MTWREWLDSEYSDENFRINGDGILYNNIFSIEGAQLEEKIQSDKEYYFLDVG